MCLIVFAWRPGHAQPLVVAANRDEFYARPTKPLAQWVEAPQVFAGRDLQAGGTWLGLTESGRFAAVTNVREPGMAKGLVSREVLEALGPNGVFVNISRGSVVDQGAMVEMLVDGKLGGAGLDVFDDEPNVPEALLSLDNVVLQPHQGSGSVEARRASSTVRISRSLMRVRISPGCRRTFAAGLPRRISVTITP